MDVITSQKTVSSCLRQTISFCQLFYVWMFVGFLSSISKTKTAFLYNAMYNSFKKVYTPE